jgi:hypothetical protein
LKLLKPKKVAPNVKSYSKVAEHNWGMSGRTSRAKGPRKFFNLESLKCHFLDFGEDLKEF